MKFSNFLSKISVPSAFKAIVVLIIGLILTGAMGFYTHCLVKKQEKRDFELACSEIKNKITTRLDAHSLLLRSSSAFLSASDTVTRTEWKTYIENSVIHDNLQGYQGLGFNAIIQKKDLKNHINHIRRYENLKDYNIKPEGERDIYTPIFYIEPFSGKNLRALGYDTYSEPVRRYAMELSCDSDRSILTKRLKLIQNDSTDNRAGIIMYAPVYKKNMPHSTLEERRKSIIGWVSSPYLVNELMYDILGQWDSISTNRIHLHIHDQRISDSTLLFDTQPNCKINLLETSAHTIFTDIYGTRWVLVFIRHQESFYHFGGKVWIVLISGLLISLLFFLLALSVFSTLSRAKEIAKRLTQNLSENESKYRLLSENISDGISLFEDNKIIDLFT